MNTETTPGLERLAEMPIDSIHTNSRKARRDLNMSMTTNNTAKTLAGLARKCNELGRRNNERYIVFLDQSTTTAYVGGVEQNNKDYTRLLRAGHRLLRNGVTQWIDTSEAMDENYNPVFAKDGNRSAHDRTLVTIATDGTRTEEPMRRVYKLSD